MEIDVKVPARVALITGAASGLGRGLALALAQQGWRIAALDCHEAGLETLAAELTPARGAIAVADVTDAAAHAVAVRNLEDQLGPTELLIASAGIGMETSAHTLKADDIARVINVNLLGVVNSVAAVLPGMLQRRRGHLVALSSVASFRGLPRMLAYCASKSGLNAFMEGIRTETRGHGIDVTTICPSWIKTPMTAALGDRLPDILELDDAVGRILWAIGKKRAFYAFPWQTAWRLNLLRWLPWTWQDAASARISRRLEG
jgi:NAD(P)-dependent dehydrogenase (short-subunit alcohol dehydrogenase family)